MLNLEIRVELEPEYIKEISVYRRRVYKWRRLNSFPLELIFDKNRNLLKYVIYIKSGRGSAHSKIKIPTTFNKDLAYLLGAMRDGSLIYSGGKHFIRLYDSSDATWIRNIENIFENLFEIKMHLRQQKKINCAYLDISSKPLYHFLSILFNGCIHKGVPEIIETAPLHLQKAYIEGFFDAEGHVPHTTKKCRIDFTQNDRDSLEFIKKVLESFDIKSAKISNHLLPICGKENIENFYNKFIFLNPLKTKRIKLLLKATPSG